MTSPTGSRAPGIRPGTGRTLWALLRSSHPEPALAVTVVTCALAAAAGRSVPGLVATGLAVLAGQLSVGWCNDALDAERDRRAGRRDKPVARGEIPARTVGTAAVVALVAAVPLSLLSGPAAALAHLVAVLGAWAYDLGAKAAAVSVVPYTVGFALLPAFVTLGLPGSPLPPWWAVAAGALLGAGAHFANTLPDLADDLATGVRGLPHRLGAGASAALAVVLLTAATAVLLVGPAGSADGAASSGLPGSVVAGAVLVVVAVLGTGLVRARRPGSRALFRAALLLALVDVGLLVAQGGSLA